MTTQTATKTKTPKGALKRAQMTAEDAAAALKLVPSPELVAAIEAEQAVPQVEAVVVEVPAPQMNGTDAMQAKTIAKPKAAKPKAAAKADGTYSMTAVYHVFQKAWAADGGKHVAYTPDEIHALLVADGGKTK